LSDWILDVPPGCPVKKNSGVKIKEIRIGFKKAHPLAAAVTLRNKREDASPVEYFAVTS
jgi:hypothetical protein